MELFDLVIVGAGSGNSIITSEMDNWRIAVVERDAFGGTCLNRGCIPTKMFVRPADLALQATTSGPLGVHTRFDSADWPAIVARTFGRIDPIAAGGEEYRRSLPNVRVYSGTGRFVDHKTMEVDGETFTGEQFVIATGARPMIPEIPGLAEVPFHTSDTIMRIAELPARLTILGGGFIACEFAHVFASLGTEVTVVNRGRRLLAAEDDDVSVRLTERLATRMRLVLGTHVESVANDGPTIRVTTTTDGRVETIDSDVLLVATGRELNGDLLGVEHTGLSLGTRNEIPVDTHGRTSVQGIWSIGDANGRYQLKHMANGETRVVAHNLVHPDDLRSFETRPAPHAVFTNPEVASVGITERAAVAAGIAHVAVTHDYAGAAWGWALEDRSSFAKLIGDPTTGRLLGAHIIGPQASTLVSLLVQGMYLGNTVAEMARDVVYIHPAPSEVVEQALLKLDEAMSSTMP